MTAIFRSLAAAFVLLAATLPQALADFTRDRVLGEPEAPITIIEYSSLTCPHCAAFHRDTLPRIKAEYIVTGKVRLIYRDFPLDQLALAAAMLAHCAPQERYFRMIEAMFRSQDDWARAADPGAALMGIARLVGMSQGDVEACLGNEDLIAHIQSVREEAQSRFGVNSTPTFIINGQVVAGNRSFDEFARILDGMAR